MFVFLLSYLILTCVTAINVAAQVNYRLPSTIVPVNYSIHITFDTLDAQTDSFSGVTEITIQIVEDTKQIKLNARELNISSILLLNGTNQTINVTNDGIDEETEILTITTTEELRKNENYKLQISYQGVLNELELDGVYKNTYWVTNGTLSLSKYLATTQFETISARRAFPGFDEPAFKATFTLSITAPDGYSAQSNTPEQNSTTSGGYTTTTFKETPIMSTYLIAFTVSQFTFDEGQIGTVPYKVWSRDELASKRGLALKNGPLLMTELGRTFNTSYESTGIGKMDVYALVDFDAGAMENWGHVTFREVMLLYDGTVYSEQLVTTTIAHEFTHMWTGDLVTLAWWSDVFLNEGFADYYAKFATHNVFPEFEMNKQFVTEDVQSALRADSDETSLALSSNVSKNTDIGRKFDTISYSKGASIIRMVANLLGTETFEKGLQNYIDAFQYTNVLADDLWSTLEQVFDVAPNLTLSTVMRNWTVEPGYPYINVTSTGNDTIISQKRFVFSGEFDTEWYVPISYRTSSNANFSDTTVTDWLRPSESLVLSDVLTNEDWIIFNTQETGFYRVLYDENLLDRVQLVLYNSPDIIHESNRAQILDDLENFAEANITKYSRFLNFIGYMKNETEQYPWRAALNGISNMLNNLNSETLRIKIKNYAVDLLNNIYESVPFDSLKPDDHSYTMKQILILDWACRLGCKDCIENANALFQRYKETNERPDANVRSVVYCSALRQSTNLTDFNFLWDKFDLSNDGAERQTILKSLGCSEDVQVLRTYLDLIFASESKIRIGELSTAVSSMYSGNNEVGLNLLLEYLVSNYQTVHKRYGRSKKIESLVEDLAKRFTASQQYDQLRGLLYQTGFETDLKRTIETATSKDNVRLTVVDSLKTQLVDHFEMQDGLQHEVVGEFT